MAESCHLPTTGVLWDRCLPYYRTLCRRSEDEDNDTDGCNVSGLPSIEKTSTHSPSSLLRLPSGERERERWVDVHCGGEK
ncbi:hypothetical protein C4D60_Mb08t08930 [Musa balbisiana]|uniref:Uncharacterized protein n=1 Tax=Musa balbisiana TaxID=52838 RepID=A0A4S8K2E4_MUSBA|nr:hypothetical protein C4D60_Mb08t08930 [Musa balbisiana]